MAAVKGTGARVVLSRARTLTLGMLNISYITLVFASLKVKLEFPNSVSLNPSHVVSMLRPSSRAPKAPHALVSLAPCCHGLVKKPNDLLVPSLKSKGRAVPIIAFAIFHVGTVRNAFLSSASTPTTYGTAMLVPLWIPQPPFFLGKVLRILPRGARTRLTSFPSPLGPQDV